MTIREYLNSKDVQWEELKEHFREINHFHKPAGEDEDKCLSCRDGMNFRWVPSGPWSSTQYCYKCNKIHFIIRPDQMGGDHYDSIYVYEENNRKTKTEEQTED